MPYDLVIKNGTVIDGSGMPRYRADVAVQAGRIASIGRIRDSAKEVVDAEGLVVAPGFVDGHTHMDAQIFWDPIGTSSRRASSTATPTWTRRSSGIRSAPPPAITASPRS